MSTSQAHFYAHSSVASSPCSPPHLLAPSLSELTIQNNEMRFYQQKYLEMKSINKAIIAAIRRVYSQEVAMELETLVEQRTNLAEKLQNYTVQNHFVDQLCMKMKSWGSKMDTQQAPEHLTHMDTPYKKYDNSSHSASSLLMSKYTPSPFKRRYEHPYLSNSGASGSMKPSEEASTYRTATAVRSQVATKILCELCQKVYPPNEFVNHAERCKYQLEYVPGTPIRGNSNVQLNYTKMMKNLIKIRQEIESQIQIIAHTREQVNRSQLKKQLQKDLKSVMKVIHQKEAQLKKRKQLTSKQGLKSKKDGKGSRH